MITRAVENTKTEQEDAPALPRAKAASPVPSLRKAPMKRRHRQEQPKRVTRSRNSIAFVS